MIAAIIGIFVTVTTWLISFLPAGPNPSDAAETLVHNAVGFIKALDTIIPVDVELAAITAIVVWQVAKMAFRGMNWAFKRIIK